MSDRDGADFSRSGYRSDPLACYSAKSGEAFRSIFGFFFFFTEAPDDLGESTMNSPERPADETPSDEGRHEQAFPVTRRTLVEKVRRGGEEARLAQEELCGLSWYPIYAFLRRNGYDREDAEDFTQGFFAKVLAEATIEMANRVPNNCRGQLFYSLIKDSRSTHLLRSEQSPHNGWGGDQFISFLRWMDIFGNNEMPIKRASCALN